MSLLELFCAVDEFCVRIEAQQNAKQIGKSKRGRKASLCGSEVMTILIYFHQSHYRDFKAYYSEHVQKELRSEFPGLVSSGAHRARFVELIPAVVPYLLLSLLARLGKTRGIAFIDSTFLASNCTW